MYEILDMILQGPALLQEIRNTVSFPLLQYMARQCRFIVISA